MTSILERMAFGMGKTLRAFRSGMADDTRAIRPGFLGATAEAGKWKGGSFNPDRIAAQQRAIQNSWVFTAINEKAMEVSKGRLSVYQDDGVTDDGEPIAGHQLTRILRKPNPLMGRALFWQFTHWWMDLDGNAYWFLAPDAVGELAEIWPLPSNAVTVWPGTADRMLDYYEYQANGVIYRIPSEYICHLKYPNPFDIFRGMSPLVAGMLPVDSDTAMARWNGAFFGSDNVMPSAVINLSSGNPNAPIDPADVDAVKSQLEDDYAAYRRKTVVTNAYQMAVNLLGYSAKDMDFLGGRQATKDEIYQILGYPPGYADKNATESNSTVGYAKFMERVYAIHGLYAEQITTQIINRFYGNDLEARFADIRPINQDMRLREADASKPDMTINERRKKFWNLPPHPDGDRLPDPTGQAGPIPAGLEDGFAADVMPTVSNALMESTRSVREIDLRNWRAKAIKSLKLGQPAGVLFKSNAIDPNLADAISDGLACADLPEDVRAVFERAQKNVIRSWRPWSTYEERLAAELGPVLRSQADQLIERLRENGDPAMLEDAALWAAMAAGMQHQIEPLLLQLTQQAVTRVQATLGKTAINANWDLANEQAAAWAKQHSGDLVTNVMDTTRREVGQQVAEWSQTGEGLEGLTRRIEAMTEEGGRIFTPDRAETIAITEATNTYSGANALSWQAAGYTPAAYKPAAHVRCRCYLQPWKMRDGSRVLVWYTARDERVCSEPLTTPWGVINGCRDLHRTIVSEGQYLGKKVD
ncbi:MAG: phage portal protein [Bellilinea sp.]